MQVVFAAAYLSATPILKSISANFYTGGNGLNESYVYTAQNKTWDQARLACRAAGAHLATILNADDQAAVQKSLNGVTGEVWFGLSDIVKESNYQWIDDSPKSFLNWITGQPDDSGGNEDCTAVVPNSSFKWADRNCANTLPYLCQIYQQSIGSNLQIWYEGTWKTVGSNSSGVGAPSSISWSTTDQNLMKRLFYGEQQTLNFAVTPVAPNGNGTAEVSVDYAEVTVKYTLP
jgi:hypothetical protein